MTRTPDTNTEKLNDLYKKRDVLERKKTALHSDADIFLDVYFIDFSPTLEKKIDAVMTEARIVSEEIKQIQAEIDKLLDADI